MNQNFMKSSFKAVAAALVASLAFTSCSKDQFTEKDALNLELQRLRAQRSIDSIKTAQDRTDRNSLLRYQRTLDSLDRENAGGRVFYTVNVISATSSAVAGGRTEESEGVTGAVVTTSQYGRVVSATTQSGIATFELRSGEATVAVTAPAHTSADYTVNLTAPFSGGQTGNSGSAAAQTAGVVSAAKNGTTVYVGNVLPLFQASTDGAVMATIRGRVFIETDLTNDVEELANTQNAAIQAAGTVANIFVSAGINSNNDDFFNRYLAKTGAFSTSGTNLGGSAMAAGLGRITKLFYGAASAPPATGINAGSGATTATVNRVPVSATGDYTILVPATVSGLPIVIKSDEILAQRTYFRSDALGLGQLTTQRFMYGPQVTADAVELGASVPRVTFQAFTTPATVTASYTPQVVSGTFTTNTNYANGVRNATTGAATAVSGGFYAVTPSVTVTGTTGTGVAAGNIGDAPTGSIATASTNPAFVNVGATAFANLPASTTPVGIAVTGVEISAGGTGYTAVSGVNNDGVATFTRNDVVPAVGNGFRVAGATGSQISNFIQVVDGGFGFVYQAPATYDVTNRTGGFTSATVTSGFTGALPVVSFGNILAPATTPVALVVPEPVLGTITSINVPTGGNGSNLSSIPQPVFTYGTQGALPPVDAGSAPLFRNAGAGGIRFNVDPADVNPAENLATIYEFPVAWGTPGTDYAVTVSSITLTPQTLAAAAAQQASLGSGYTFVPATVATANGGSFPSITPASFTVTVQTSITPALTVPPAGLVTLGAGTIRRIDISAPGNYSAAGIALAADAPIVFPLTAGVPTPITSIGLNFLTTSVPTGSSRTTNSLSALAFAGGSGLALDNYVITTPAPTVTRGGIAGATATNIFTAASLSGYPGALSTAITSTLVNPNAPLTAMLAANLLAASPWIVAFDAPATGNQAWGIPYIDNVSGVNTISGVRVMNGGSGYPAATTAVPMTLMPNPFRNNTANATTPVAIALSAMGPADASSFFEVVGQSIAVRAGVRLLDALSNSGNIGLELPAVGASLTFTVTNAGAGYAATPRVVIADGGLTFGAIATALNPTFTGGSAGSTDVTPVVMTGSATAGAGASLTRVGNTFTGSAANVGRISFAVGSDPGFLSAPAVFVIDGLSSGLTDTYNAAVAAGAALATATTTVTGAVSPTNPFGGLTKEQLPAITIGANGAIVGLGSLQTANNQTVGQMSKLPETFILNANGLPTVGFHVPPTVTIAAPATGTAATAVIDPAGVETATFIPGIRATGTNGTSPATLVNAVTAANAVPGTSGVTTIVATNTTAGVLNAQIVSGALIPAVVSSTGGMPVGPTTAGSGAATNYLYAIPANTTVTFTVTATAVAVGANPAPVATNGPLTAAAVTMSSSVAGVLTTVAANAAFTGVAGTTGTGAVTAVAGVAAATLVNGTLPGEIQAIRVTSGGSGYGRGNLYQRWFVLNNGINQGTTTATATALNGQDYVIIGSNLSSAAAAGTGPQLGVTGSAFDVMTGVTYVRDIHYGTGRRID